MFSKPFAALRTNLFLICISALLIFGWNRRDDNYLSAESGTGYMLGIIGGSLMLILLLYPVSKRIALLTRLLPIRYWFGIHMLFGILGPVMILFHSNFQLGSTNSSIALICMLLVAASGLVGRYIYTNIHHGLYGARMTLKELKQQTADNHAELITRYHMSPEQSDVLNSHLNRMEQDALQPHNGVLKNLSHVINQAVKTRYHRKKIIRLINDTDSDQAHADKQAVIRSVRHYTTALQQAVAFKLYERLFSLWHIFHLPLFIMMIITAIIHIIAVHIY